MSFNTKHIEDALAIAKDNLMRRQEEHHAKTAELLKALHEQRKSDFDELRIELAENAKAYDHQSLEFSLDIKTISFRNCTIALLSGWNLGNIEFENVQFTEESVTEVDFCRSTFTAVSYTHLTLPTICSV